MTPGNSGGRFEWFAAFRSQLSKNTHNSLATSFPGSFILGNKDPGSGWSRASQKVGGDKKNAVGRGKQVEILPFLNSLWKGQICLKM